jgi:uncharacterized protein YdhG (YjbR/CyaY superfamily)
MKDQIANFDEYFSNFPESTQRILGQVRKVIRDNAPGARETISYRMPTFHLHGNLVHFAAYPNHLGLYPAPSAISAFKAELDGYKHARGSVQFPLDKPIPYDLIARIVRFRVAEQLKAKVQ